MSFGFGWALPTLPALTSRHWYHKYTLRYQKYKKKV
jgi:hypothetical protein